MERQPQTRDKLFWPIIWALTIHVVLISLLFVSFSRTPELPPSRPLVKATLYQLESQNMATTQTQEKIAGEAEKTRTQDYAQEQLEQKKREQEQAAAARRKAEEERKVAAQKAEQEKQQAQAAAQKKQAEEKAAAERKAAEQRKLELQKAEAARLKAAEEAKAKAEEARRKAEAEKKKLAEQQKAEAERKKAEEQRKLAEEQRKKAEAEKKKRDAEQAAKVAAEKAREAERRAQEDRTAAALAELLGDGEPQRQATAGDRQGEQQMGRIDDLIVQLVSQNWSRPDAARNGMQVVLDVEFLADGTISRVVVARSSGNPAFDNSALAAVRSVARVREIQNLDRATYERFYRKRSMAFRPEDLSQ